MRNRTRFQLLLTLILLSTMEAQETRYFRVSGPVAVRVQGLTPDGFLTWTNEAVDATFTVQTAASLADPTNWVDYVQVPVFQPTTVHRIFDPNPPSGMVLVPAGSFTMGAAANEGNPVEHPTHTVYVSAVYMDQYEVTRALWDEVYGWAITHGYSFDNSGSGKAANHPVQTVNWYDVVKWCNARSEKEGRVPAYYRDADWTTVYRTGRLTIQNAWVSWNRGYRLPTEAEWEKAARGGLSGKRFPWGDTISHSQANYWSDWLDGSPRLSYDVNPTEGLHPSYATGEMPYTSPVGSFGANGYRLYDMAGNVAEWCWDWEHSYPSGSAKDPWGPEAGPGRIVRGGGFDNRAFSCRSAVRFNMSMAYGRVDWGFRSVRASGH